MTDFVKLYSKDSYLNVDWQLSNKCNYHCSYCNFDSNGGNLDWIDISLAKKLVDKLMSRSLKTQKHKFRNFTLFGGEPTLWKNIVNLCEHIKQFDNNQICILTNGFRNVKWWKNNKQYFDQVIISYHNQFAKIDHIIDVANNIDDSCDTQIQILADYANFPICQKAFYRCLNEINYAKVSVKKGETNLGSREWMPYSEQQIEWLKEVNDISSQFTFFNRFNTKRRYNKIDRTTIVEYSNSETAEVNLRSIAINGQNDFHNWMCNIGIDAVAIRPDGSVLPSSACNKHLIIGNYLLMPFDKFRWQDTPTRCQYGRCNCLTDIAIPKYKIL